MRTSNPLLPPRSTTLAALALCIATAALQSGCYRPPAVAIPSEDPARDAISPGAFGAIAYSKSTGKNGGTFAWGTRQEAERASARYCGESDCQVLVWVQSSCAALAVGDGATTGWSVDGRRGRAERRALEECSARTKDCHIVRWVCT
ncbi:MAG: DUF4189 domain-containing protein [Polyangiaceae bacterium]